MSLWIFFNVSTIHRIRNRRIFWQFYKSLLFFFFLKLHLGSNPTEKSTRYQKLLKKNKMFFLFFSDNRKVNKWLIYSR
ncbi:hypothetical protein AHAS_Ahas08G0046000 [Arachis hypogaea]